MKIRKMKNKLLQIYYKPINKSKGESNINILKKINDYLEKILK